MKIENLVKLSIFFFVRRGEEGRGSRRGPVQNALKFAEIDAKSPKC
jgi:hypothetical protein